MENIEFARFLGRKRIVVSENMEASDSPLKKVCSAKFNFNFNSDFSLLEALPQDILLHVLCGVEHRDLEQLFHVSKTIREATLIVEESHFKFMTPKKKNVKFQNNQIDSIDECVEIEIPKTPMKKPKESKFNWDELSDTSMVLFCVKDWIGDEDYE